MTPGERIEIDHRQERLDWMRDEFRAAQQRRYEKGARGSPTATEPPAPAVTPEPPAVAPLFR